ncbi:uracil-DNA glycosylase [Pseudooceanicola sp. C21-150M6]|uniref:uracil-DNA glycosylase n=1 Tax=Pseudooceanicola sp. C21-150M6 TaxID=3434355 RepID=UPI003D7FA869
MIPEPWAALPFFETSYPRISGVLSDLPAVLPPECQRFAALNLCPPDQTRVIILGQDPYPTPGHAHGLAFSVEPNVLPLPRSLYNIFKELRSDLGGQPDNGDLRFWARQGVLLLNTALSVPAGKAGGHARLGWAELTMQVIDRLSDRPRAFVLWGNHAQSFRQHIRPPASGDRHLILASAHPSPLSARRGFFGSRPFSTVNNWLKSRGEPEIDWIGAHAE